MNKYTICVGLLDQKERVQLISTDEAIKKLTDIFIRHTGGATIYQATGVYTHNDGEIVVEPSMVCLVYSDDGKAVNAACDEILAAFNQESVTLESQETNSIFYPATTAQENETEV